MNDGDYDDDDDDDDDDDGGGGGDDDDIYSISFLVYTFLEISIVLDLQKNVIFFKLYSITHIKN